MFLMIGGVTPEEVSSLIVVLFVVTVCKLTADPSVCAAADVPRAPRVTVRSLVENVC